MNNRSKLFGYRIYFFALLGVTLLTLILRTVSTLSHLDEIGYFDHSVLPTLTAVLQGLAVLGCVVYPFFIQKDVLPTKHPGTLVGKIAAGVAALATLAAAVLVLTTVSAEQSALTVLAALTLLVGAAYFLARIRGLSNNYALLAFGIILGAILMISLTYFDLFTPMNSPRKTSLHLCLLSLSLFLLYEMRMAVSRPLPRVLAAVTAVCLLLTFSMGFSNLIHGLTADVGRLYLAGDLLSLGIGLYAGVRMAEPLLTPAADPEHASTGKEIDQ